MKYRKLTPAEAGSVKVNHYETGFSLWIRQPDLKDERCILDASLLFENGIINLHPPKKHPNGDFTYGSILSKDNPNEIMLVAIV